MLEDKLLILKCKRGNEDAMCRVYEKYKDYLLTLAKGLLGEQEMAEDIVHDIFIAFVRSVERFQLRGNLRAYLATCVRNLARDKIRSRTRQAQVLDSINPITLCSDNPARSLIESEELTQLRDALKQIPYEQRETIMLRIKGGMKFREIAKLQGVSLRTTYGRYRYGLDKLRSLLNNEVDK